MEELAFNKQVAKLCNEAVQSMHGKKNYQRALESLLKAESMDHQNPVILYNVAIVYIHLKEYSKSIGYLLRCLNLPMTFIDIKQVKKLYIFALIQNNNIDEALRQIEKINWDDEIIAQFEAYSYEKKGDYEKSLALYESILKKNPQNVNVCNAVAYILAKIGADYNRALLLAKKALAADPENAAYCDTIGYVYYKKKQIDMAKKFLKKALSLKPDDIEIRKHLDELLTIE